MNSIYNPLSPKVGVEKGPHTSECTSSQGFVVRLTGTLMNLCLCLAWMQTVHIVSSCVYPLTRDFMAVGFICASRWCHSLDSEIVRDLVLAAIRALDDSIVGSIVGSVIVGSIVGFAIVGSIVCSIVGSIVGSAISTLELSLFLCFSFSVVDKSAVAGTMIYMPLISSPARVQENGEVMEHFPS